MDQHEMIRRGDRVLAGVSGGADSVCLLSVLHRLSKDCFELRAVHVHHGLRSSADEDAEFVKRLCGRLGVPCTVVRVDAASYAARHGMGTEEAARILRYRAFRETAAQWKNEDGGRIRIATAHHREDQAETVLFHLCRGSSLAGLAGIRPVRDDVIHPLLELSRRDIEWWLAENRLSYCTDETNADTAYARNYLRHCIFPLLEEHVNAASAEHFAQASDDARSAEEYLRRETDRACALADNRDGTWSVPKLLEMDAYLRRRVLLEILSGQTGHRKDLSRGHIRILEELLAGSGSRRADFPYGVTACCEYDRLTFLTADAGLQKPAAAADGHCLCIPLSENQYEVRQLAFSGEMGGIPAGQYTKWFDYDKIGSFLVFRTRKPGDRILLDEKGGHKLLSRVLIDEKIPSSVRDRMIFPCCGRDVLWVPGLRVNAQYKVCPATHTVLQIRFQAENS